MSARSSRSTQAERAARQCGAWREEGWPRRLTPGEADTLLAALSGDWRPAPRIPDSGINLSSLAKAVTR